MRGECEELLPETLLDLPEVGGLAGEGGPMDLKKCREPFTVVPSEVAVECLVGVYPQELADHFDGEDLGVGELGGRAALAVASLAALEPIVYEAEDGHDEGAKIHERRPPLRRLVWSLPSVGRSSLRFKPSKKLAHGVS